MVEHRTPFEALEAAVERAGSQAAFARLCGVTQAAVWKWLANGKWLPPQHAIAIETATGVSRHDLRPDIYPHDAPASFQSHNGVVSSAAQIVACDRSTVLHRGDQ
jgi:DNA-binding transcriptional regulator YdaS (Cro superfamily)